MQSESKYFCIAELSEAAEKSLKNLKDKESAEVVPICRVPLITSQKEEQVCLELVLFSFLGGISLPVTECLKCWSV